MRTWLRVSLDSHVYPSSHAIDGAEFVDNQHNRGSESGATPWLFAPVSVPV